VVDLVLVYFCIGNTHGLSLLLIVAEGLKIYR